VVLIVHRLGGEVLVVLLATTHTRLGRRRASARGIVRGVCSECGAVGVDLSLGEVEPERCFYMPQAVQCRARLQVSSQTRKSGAPQRTRVTERGSAP
jgi:hypothetical protein